MVNFELRLKSLYNQKIIIQESEQTLKILQTESQKLKESIRKLAQDIGIKKKALLESI